jgi:hypothetical protein
MNAATTGSTTSADVRFDAHYGLKSDIARGPKSATSRPRALQRNDSSTPTVGSVFIGRAA